MSIQEKIYRYFEQYPDLHVLFVFDPNNVHSMELMGAQWPENREITVIDLFPKDEK